MHNKPFYLCVALMAAIFTVPSVTSAVPVVYTNEASYLAALEPLAGSTIHESFEDDVVWADSRNSIVAPGSTPSVTSQGIVWTSNYPSPPNNIATGTVGGSAPDGSYAIYALPHGMTTDSGLYCDSAEDPNVPLECFQNDGLKVESAAGGTLYAFGGRIDTANSGKVTFLLDGVDINGNDTDNIDNWQREGDLADNWSFVGVIDTGGFLTAELRELKGKDYQQVLLFTDDFTIQMAAATVQAGDFDGDGDVDGRDFLFWQIDPNVRLLSDWETNYGTVPPLASSAAVPEPRVLLLSLMAGLVGVSLRRHS